MNDKEYNREYYHENKDRIKSQRKQKAATQPKKKRRPGRKKGSGMTEDAFLENHNDIVMVFERQRRRGNHLFHLDYSGVREMTGKSIATIGKVKRILKGRKYNDRGTPGRFRYPENCGMRGSEIKRY